MTRPAIEEAERIIEIAAKMHRWDEMVRAIDVLIERQQVVVQWWHDHVQSNHRPALTNAAPALVNVADAEATIGFKQYQVSRLNTALDDIDAYHQRLIERARLEAAAWKWLTSTVRSTPSVHASSWPPSKDRSRPQ